MIPISYIKQQLTRFTEEIAGSGVFNENITIKEMLELINNELETKEESEGEE